MPYGEVEPHEKSCEICGDIFMTSFNNRKYCDACRSYSKKVKSLESSIRRRECVSGNMTKTSHGLLPKGYESEAFETLGNRENISYGKMSAWRESHRAEYSEWLDAVYTCYRETLKKINHSVKNEDWLWYTVKIPEENPRNFLK